MKRLLLVLVMVVAMALATSLPAFATSPADPDCTVAPDGSGEIGVVHDNSLLPVAITVPPGCPGRIP